MTAPAFADRSTRVALTVVFVLALTVAMLIAPPRAQAHRGKAGHTTVLWKPPTSSLEVTHRLHVHDAAVALAQVTDLAQPDLTTVEARARLALYVEEHFSLSIPGGEALALELIGAQLEGNHVFVFQEVTLEKPPSAFVVSCTYLQEVFPDQVNTVNVSFGRQVRTVVFNAGDEAREVRKESTEEP